MLAPEVAKERLKTWQIEADETRYLPEIKALPAKLRTIAYGLLGRDAKGEELQAEDWQQRKRLRDRAIRPLDDLTSKDRVRLFGMFFCGLGPAIESAWQLLKRFPYQETHGRKSFRAAGDESITFERRVSWLDDMMGVAAELKSDVLTPAWLAAWAPHLGRGYGAGHDSIGRLLAAVIDGGGKVGDEVFDILCQSIRNEHEVGGMGRHVIRGLLMASRPEGWELVEKTLIAAQRQEGLRQVIVETVDEAHPEAFIRMLRLIREHDLARFSAVVRAVNVWFGLAWDSVSVKVVNDTIDRVLTLLADEGARKKALAGNDAEDVFWALWSIAFFDAQAAIPVAAELLQHGQEEIRFVTAVHLCQLALPQADAVRVAALDDEDLRIAWQAFGGAPWQEAYSASEADGGPGFFERLERLFARLPEKPASLKPLVWPWTEGKTSREQVAALMAEHLGNRPPTALIPYLPAMSNWGRRSWVLRSVEQKKWDGLTRETLIRLAGDASSDVRGAVYAVLPAVTLEPQEILALEDYLTRKSNDLRQGILPLLLAQSDDDALASSERLLAASDAQKRLGGLELLRQLSAADRSRAECQARAEAYRAGRRKLSGEEQVQIDGILESAKDAITLDNGLGLFDPSQRSAAIAPTDRKVQFVTKAAVACLRSLDDLIHEHREEPIKVKNWRGEEREELLGNMAWNFPSPDREKPKEKAAEALPLREVWQRWHAARPKTLRDKDGFELTRAEVWFGMVESEWEWRGIEEWAKNAADDKELSARVALLARLTNGQARTELKYPHQVSHLVNWLMFLYPPEGELDFLLDAVETSFALVPPGEMSKLSSPGEKTHYGYFNDSDWRTKSPFSDWGKALGERTERAASLTSQQSARVWRLARWYDEPFAGAVRRRPDYALLARSYDTGDATFADFADNLLGPDVPERSSFSLLSTLTARKLEKDPQTFLARHAEIRDLVEACRARIVEIELARGETPTVATPAAHAIQALWGAELLLQLLAALGKQGFKVVAGYRAKGLDSKPCTLTHLVSVTYPRADDTAEKFAPLARKAMKEGWLTEKLLLELAFLAPQWVKHIAAALGWAGFDEALYWFLAHMRYASATEQAAVGAGVEDAEPSESESASEEDDRTKPSAWERLIAERTPLSDADRRAGAVDVGWFRKTYEGISPKRWQAMAAGARFAANAAQAKHAQFVADVLTGKASRKQLVDGIRKKQLKDHVRLLGLYPLASGAKREKDLAERYEILQDYRRYARGLSSMSKPEAMRSLEVGMQNLASTAGYADPLRLEWAMEAERVKELADGPLSVTKAGVTVTLALDADAKPQVTVERGGKPLKSIPPALKKEKKIIELTEQAADLKRQASRMQTSLEEAMCRGDTFSGEELGQLCRHPILAPQLSRLVLVGEGILGYPEKLGKALRDAAGKLEPVKKNEPLRIAHPHDLLESKAWPDYQKECFQAERVQPFKQVFRELYVVTKQEKRDGTVSNRYAQQQIQPTQAMALWGQRGWHTQEGVWKTFFDVGLTVSVNFQYGGGTPLEVEGLTIGGVEFRPRDDYRPLKLADVPPRIFSEAMRDIDLVVSVAHRGGVDPEASASTVEMRATLLRETCSLLGLKNVRIKSPHVLIDGSLANYSVHLGSATVHRMPGGSICLVAVPAQHRGRLFLPFADDDPRTAEVLSKVILLARDSEIQDPTVLDQIRR